MTRTRAVPAPGEVSARDRLASAALALFNSKGYAATTVREIVAAAGVTKPVLYYHFKNKEGIFLHLMTQGFAEFESILRRAAGRPGPVAERIRRLLDDTFELCLRRTAEVRLMYSLYYGPKQGAPYFDFERHHELFRRAVRRMIRDGVKTGELRDGDVEKLAWVVIGALSVTMELHLCHPEKAIGREGLSQLFDIILVGLARPQSRLKRVSR